MEEEGSEAEAVVGEAVGPAGGAAARRSRSSAQAEVAGSSALLAFLVGGLSGSDMALLLRLYLGREVT